MAAGVGVSDLEKVTCCLCTIEFGLTEAMSRIRQKDHLNFYCPNGHAQCYSAAKSTVAEDLAAAQARVTELEKRVAELELELETWRPRAKETGS